MMYNSAINLDVTKNSSSFNISGANSKISISGETQLLNDGSAILNGQFLMGSSGENAFLKGGITAGSGILIASGAGALRIDVLPYLNRQIITKSGNYTYTVQDDTVIYTGIASTGAMFTKLAVASAINRAFVVKHAGSGTLTVSGDAPFFSSGLVNSISMSRGDSYWFHSDGVTYYVY